jgi:hypothetical protein
MNYKPFPGQQNKRQEGNLSHRKIRYNTQNINDRKEYSCLTAWVSSYIEQSIPFVNSVKYLGVILDKKITWRLDIETVATKAFRTFNRLYSLLKSDRLSTNSKLTLHKVLIRSIMTYTCTAWEFTADTHLMKLPRLQNKVLLTTGKFPRNTPIRDMHISLQIPYVYDYITKLCRQQAQVIQHHENIHVCNIEQGEVRHRKYKRLKLGIWPF